MTGWITLPLGELCRFKAGSAFPQNQQGSTAGDYPFVKVSDLSSSANSKFLNAANNWISADQVATMRPAIAPAGAVLFAKIGEGLRSERCRVATRGTAFDNNLMSAVAIEKNCDPSFLFYLMQTVGLSDYAEGSALPYLKQSVLQKVPCTVPAVYEQRAIAEVLGALDDKIAANTKLVQTLDNLFRAEWQGVDKAASEDQCSLDSLICDIFAGDWGASEETPASPEQVLCIRGADLNALQTSGMGKMPTRFLKTNSLNRRRLVVGDIVIEASGGSPTQSTGRTALISDALLSRFDVPLSSSNFCKALRMKDSKDAFLVYGHLRNSWDRGEFFQYENGTTGIKNLALPDYLSDKKIMVPDAQHLQTFNAISAGIFEKMQITGQESDLLAATRDALLPQLMSGKLRVKDAEQTVGELI